MATAKTNKVVSFPATDDKTPNRSFADRWGGEELYSPLFGKACWPNEPVRPYAVVQGAG